MKAKCPCGYMLKLKPELAGKKVKCPKCGQVSRIPKSLATQAADSEPEPKDDVIEQGDLTRQAPPPSPFDTQAAGSDDFFGGSDTTTAGPASKESAPIGIDFGTDAQGPTSKDSSAGLDFNFGGGFEMDEGDSPDSAAGSEPAPGGGMRLGFEEPDEEEDSFATAQGGVATGAPAPGAGGRDGIDFDLGGATLEGEEVVALKDDQILEMNVGGHVSRPAMGMTAGAVPHTQVATQSAAATAPVASLSWFSYLPTAWTFPFRGMAKWMVIGYVPLYIVISSVANMIMPIGIGFMGIARILLEVILQGFYWSFLLQAVAGSASEPTADAAIPDVTDFWHSFARPFLLVILMFFVAFFLLWGTLVAGIFLPPAVTRVLFIVAAVVVPLYWPLALLCAGVSDSFSACNPFFVLRSLPTILPGYLLPALVCNLLLFVYMLGVGGTAVAALLKGFALPHSVALAIFLKMLGMYFAVVVARLLGTYYYCKGERFKW